MKSLPRSAATISCTHRGMGLALVALGAISLLAAFAWTRPRRLAVVEGLRDPEAVIFDPAVKAYFVSNVNGSPGVKDGNGFITRISSNGTMDSMHFIQGGRDGVTLNAPMGSRVRGDTLWVLDVDMLRAFNTRTGAPLAAIDFAPLGALFLNDLAFGPDGDVYLTDTGVRVHPGGRMESGGPNRIYRVGRNRRPAVALETPALDAPDGIDWDSEGNRFVLAPFGGTAVQAWRPGQPEPINIAPGKGKFDGLEARSPGTILVTSWNDSSVSRLEGGRLVRQIGPLPFTPADVSLDPAGRRVGIVSLEANRFELWTWPE